MYNPRTNRIECPYCRGEMRPFGGRLTPGFADMPEVFLCIGCAYSIDLAWAVVEALNQRAAIRRRAESAQRYVAIMTGQNGNGHPNGKQPLRKRMVRGLIRVLEKAVED